MAKQKVLNAINGNNGIVSTIGNVNKNKGNSAGAGVLYNNIPNEVGFCDSLAKIFFRTMEPKNNKPGAVYTSVIHRVSDNTLYFSFQGEAGGKNPAGLNDGEVNNLVTTLKGAKINPIDLFVTMITHRNNIMVGKLKNYTVPNTRIPSSFNESLEALKKYNELDRSTKTRFHQKQKQNLLNNPGFQDFVREAIAIDDFGAIRDFLQDKSISLVPFEQDRKTGNYGVHVEAKGLYEARQNGEIKTGAFNIGLAIVKEEEPAGCCAGCSAEFTALSKVHTDLRINKTNDLPYNFPPTNYQVSHNVKNDEVVLENFSDIILKNAHIVNNNHQLNLINELKNFERVIKEEFAPKMQEKIEEEELVWGSSPCKRNSEFEWKEETEEKLETETEEEEFESWEARYDGDHPFASTLLSQNESTLTAAEDAQDY